MSELFTIHDTHKYGTGVFAARDIARGEIIHQFTGETVSMRDLIARVKSGNEHIDDPLQVGKRTYLDLDAISRAFNHSCDPNAALRKRSELFALRDIRKGEELTYDYSLTIAPTQWHMKCKCGTTHCRGVLGDVLSIPKRIRARYRNLGSIQTYMRRLLDALEREGSYRMPSYEITALASLKTPPNER